MAWEMGIRFIAEFSLPIIQNRKQSGVRHKPILVYESLLYLDTLRSVKLLPILAGK